MLLKQHGLNYYKWISADSDKRNKEGGFGQDKTSWNVSTLRDVTVKLDTDTWQIYADQEYNCINLICVFESCIIRINVTAWWHYLCEFKQRI